MSLTQIVGKVFVSRQRELEKHQNGGEALQRAVLEHLVQTAKDTEYGRKHVFGAIKGYDDFISNVPVNTYEEVEVYPCQSGGSAEDPLCRRARFSGHLPEKQPTLENVRR